MKIVNYMLILLLCTLISCNSKSHRNQKLTKLIECEKEKINILKENLVQLTRELNIIWLQSLKERFPDIKKTIHSEIRIDSKQVPYLKTIYFKRKNTKELEVTFRYKARTTGIKPHFNLFLFSNNGSNIHKEIIEYKNIFGFRKKLKPGKLITHKTTLKILNRRSPNFFIIRKNI